MTHEQFVYLRAAFESVIDSAVPHSRVGQLELFTDEDERYIQQEVARWLWEPRLPNAGDKEREHLRRLREMKRDESLVMDLKAAASRYADGLESCLPDQELIKRGEKWVKLPGCYYIRKPVTAKTNGSLYTAAIELKREATARKDAVKKWFAQYILDGMPVPISNFKMECLYLLRGQDGNVTRLVRFMNTKGEVSQGNEIGGADILPNDMYAGSEKFRQYISTKGNFYWGGDGGAGNTELQLLQVDVTEEAAYREVKLIEYCGWHEIKPRLDEKQPITPGREVMHGLWFFDECVITPDSGFLLPDDDGVYWFEGEGYVLSRKGRELDFVGKKRPSLRPKLDISQVQFDTSDWEAPASDSDERPSASEMYSTNPSGAFFREVCRRFYDTVGGGMEGWMAIGAMLGYAAAPESFERRSNFPGIWISGQAGSGKTTFCSWLMSFHGFVKAAPIGLITGSVTAVGIACCLENYSNLAIWLDEYRQNLIPKEKEPFLRDSYNRNLAIKHTADGVQRQIRTTVLVSGEGTSSDAATRGRYPHVLLSDDRRKRYGVNHEEWMNDHNEFFFFFFRELLLRRKEFAPMMMAEFEGWMKHPDVAAVPNREKISHAVCYAAFVAASRLFGNCYAETELTAFRHFVAEQARLAAKDVASDVNVNVFIQELITAYNSGAIPNECFRVEVAARIDDGHGGYWISYKLFIEPALAFNSLQIHLRKSNQTVTLREKDTRMQMSQNKYWIKATKEQGYQIIKRFGKPGSTVSKAAWGILVDEHPLGRRDVPAEHFEAALLPKNDWKLGVVGPQFKDGDPRKGDLFDIVEGVLAWEEKERRNAE